MGCWGFVHSGLFVIYSDETERKARVKSRQSERRSCHWPENHTGASARTIMVHSPNSAFPSSPSRT